MKRFPLLLFTIALSSPIYAQEEKRVEIPLTYSEGAMAVETSACLSIQEKTYAPELSDWKNFKNMTQAGPEKALIETVTAMQRKDGSRLKELSHPEFGRDPKQFEEQASAYFSQLEAFQVNKVSSYSKFDNLVVFFVRLTSNDKAGFADFPFMYDEHGNFGFLPYKSKSLALDLTRDWFQSDWGPAKSKSPSYCGPSLLNKVTHEVALEEANHSDSAAKLLLVGNKLDNNGRYAELCKQITNMQEALSHNRLDEFFDGFTEHGKKRNREWFVGETDERLRTQYIENFVAQAPFYVFDADPIFVVYTRTKSSTVKVLYFVQQGEHQFKLAGESVGSSFDRIFKSKSFIKAASEEQPFNNWKIIDRK